MMTVSLHVSLNSILFSILQLTTLCIEMTNLSMFINDFFATRFIHMMQWIYRDIVLILANLELVFDYILNAFVSMVNKHQFSISVSHVYTLLVLEVLGILHSLNTITLCLINCSCNCILCMKTFTIPTQLTLTGRREPIEIDCHTCLPCFNGRAGTQCSVNSECRTCWRMSLSMIGQGDRCILTCFNFEGFNDYRYIP